MIGDPSNPQPDPIEPSSPVRCRSCGRAIGSENAYCPHCGKRQSPAGGWLYRPITLILLGFFVLGVLVIPLVLRSPYLGRKGKTILSIALILYTILVFYSLYGILVQFREEMSELRQVLNG